MLLFISPAKTQHPDPRIAEGGKYTQPLFPEQIRQLVEYLKPLNQDQLRKLMKISKPLAEATFQKYQDFQFPFTPGNSGRSLFMFRGDQFKSMAVDDYSPEQLDHCQHHLRILSGLFGMLRPLDLMQPYRLEMAAGISVDKTKKLYEFWSEAVTREINKELSSHQYPLVVNMASAEYFKVISKKQLQARLLTLSFKQIHKGKLKTIAIYAKRARGAMVDFVMKNHISLPEDMQQFDRDGYAYDADLSSDQEWVFVCRKHGKKQASG